MADGFARYYWLFLTGDAIVLNLGEDFEYSIEKQVVETLMKIQSSTIVSSFALALYQSNMALVNMSSVVCVREDMSKRKKKRKTKKEIEKEEMY